MTRPGGAWADLHTALTLVARDPALGGAVLRMRPGPVWTRAQEVLTQMFPDLRRWPSSLSARDLSGGLDSAATLAAGRAVYAKGLLERGHPILIPSAERLTSQAAALIAQAMDAGTAPPIFLIDESADTDERVPQALADRLAFHCDLDGLSLRDLDTAPSCEKDQGAAVDAADTLVRIALRLGIDSPRAPLLALRAAKALNPTPDEHAVTQAAALVLAPRATQIPEEDEASDTPPPAQESDADQEDTSQAQDIPLEDLVVEAIRALVPSEMLDAAPTAKARSGRGFAGSGSKRRGNRRGRPLPAQAGALDGQSRLDLVATLRAAVPWQTLRRSEQPHRTGVILAPRDIHIQRVEEQSDRVLVFTVDASGSSAMARLGEVKGAVELVLARAYARRDHVALVAFRRDGAETLLQPTRSLVQAKRQLAALPGGGGTPLAAGLEEGLRQALAARGRGMTPQVILLTDGRGNIAIDGSANRAQASQDAQRMARHLAATQIDTMVIDTAARPQPQLAGLARDMHARYLPLPRARAQQISDLVAGAA